MLRFNHIFIQIILVNQGATAATVAAATSGANAAQRPKARGFSYLRKDNQTRQMAFIHLEIS
jgi:hypothetical protein